MDVVRLTSGTSSAHISVKYGFNCFSFQAGVDERVVDVIDTLPSFPESGERPSGSGIPVLFPYPNRIRGGQFTWDETTYELFPDTVAFDPNGNAIHGFCLDRPWRVVEQGEQFVTGEFQLSRDAPDRRALWPADFVIQVRYELEGPKLRSLFAIHNPDSKPLPWGLGTHPYFRLPLAAGSQADQCTVSAPVTEQWDLIDCLPTGVKHSIDEALTLSDGVYFGLDSLDDVFSGVPQDLVECSITDERAGLEVTQRNPGLFRELVLYTPPGRNAICFEPYTCVTDAINLRNQGVDTGWLELGPGETTRTWIEIEAGLVLA